MGPLVSPAQLERVEKRGRALWPRRARSSLVASAPRVTGMEDGFFFQPTVITDVPQDGEGRHDEIFGPVGRRAAVHTDEAEASRAQTPCAMAWQARSGRTNVQRAMRMSAALEFGTVWVNDHLPITAEMPHGGFKESGFGKGYVALLA